MDKLKMRDGYEIHYSIDKSEQPKALVFITHGFAEHMARYDYLASSLCMIGYDVFRHDLRGHGLNRNLGYLDSFNDYILDTDEVLKHAAKAAPGLPIFMLGHSMGGLITVLHGIKHPLGTHGHILSGPVIGSLPSAEGKSKGLMKFLSFAAGKIQLKNPIDEGLSGDHQVFRDYINDPLVLKKASLRMYYQFLFEAIDTINDNITAYKHQCLISHGENDPIVPAALSRDFIERISSQDKTLKVYDGLYHEILNEKTKDQVIADMVKWMEDRI